MRAASWLLLLCGCATGAPVGARLASTAAYEPFSRPAASRAVPSVPDSEAQRPLTVAPGAREGAVDAARRFVGKSKITVNGKRFGDDCTGLVRAVYAQVGVDLMADATRDDNGVSAIYRFAGKHGRHFAGGRPVPGVLVFFKETYDFNRDGRSNDGLTHIGVVEDVEVDGTVIVIHRVARGVVRYRMNLSHPTQAASPTGERWNDWLRAEGPGAKPQLTAQLFAGYATLLPIESHLAAKK
jgi:hypothetical protein